MTSNNAIYVKSNISNKIQCGLSFDTKSTLTRCDDYLKSGKEIQIDCFIKTAKNIKAISKRTNQLKLTQNSFKILKSIDKKKKIRKVAETNEIPNLSNKDMKLLFSENQIPVTDFEKSFDFIENSPESFLMECKPMYDTENIVQNDTNLDSKNLISCNESQLPQKLYKNLNLNLKKPSILTGITREPLRTISKNTKITTLRVNNQMVGCSKETVNVRENKRNEHSEDLMPIAHIKNRIDVIRKDHNYCLPVSSTMIYRLTDERSDMSKSTQSTQLSIAMNSVNIKSDENSDTISTPKKTTDQISDAISAMLIDFAEMKPENHFNCSNEQEISTLSVKEDCIEQNTNKSENNFERTETEKQEIASNFNTTTTTTTTTTLSSAPSNDADEQLSADFINIIEIILCKTSSSLYSKDFQNVNLYEYVSRKSRMLMRKKLTGKLVAVLQESSDYFPANNESISFFNYFFGLNENLLWTKDSNFRLTCHICKHTLKKKSSLFDHLNIHFEHYHICKVCTRKFSSKGALNRHNRLSHNFVDK